jgi:hypothetical protein
MVSQGQSQPVVLRCDHCGRVVHETIHTRSDYHVDYYSLHTGDVELCSLVSDDGEPRAFQRLIRRFDLVTCVDCYRSRAVQREREMKFRPELAQGDVV